MASSGGPRLDVSHGGLAEAAAVMRSAAGTLAALAAAPPMHAPLAPDEVSSSAAGRLTEHGAVLSSRAADGAAVLTAAALAVTAVSTSMAETDAANAASLVVGGAPAAPSAVPAAAPAVTANAIAAATPIAPMAPRTGEATAALIEAGSSGAAGAFHTACGTYGKAFEDCAAAARRAENAVASGITGQTGPQLSTALNKFAFWADAMAAHSATVEQAARDHAGRFTRTQADTPRTAQFTNNRQSLNRAQRLMMQTGGLMGSEQAVRFAGNLQRLDSTATATGAAYHLGELPQAPPPPPPVVDITNGAGNSPTAPGSGPLEPGTENASGDRRGTTTSSILDSTSADASSSEALPSDPLLAGGQGSAPSGGDPMQQILPMAAAVPSVLAGALGGILGAVTSVPSQLLGAVQQAGQSSAVSPDDEPDLSLDGAGDDPGSTGLGGGGGDVEPASVRDSMPPGGGALAAASAPSGPSALPMTTGAVAGSAAASPPGAGMGGGMGMGMMPPMGGMGGAGGGGGGASRSTAPPDKSVHIPSIPNGEPVKGETERRQTVSVDDAAAAKAARADQPVGRPRRRVAIAADREEDPR